MPKTLLKKCITRRQVLFSGTGIATSLIVNPLALAKKPTKTIEMEAKESFYHHHECNIWKGIPFAKAPINELRGMPPQPIEPNQVIIQSDTFGNQAIQQSHPPGISNTLKGSEDCLYLNIWSPKNNQRKLPVIVWIHGGGFVTGSSSDEPFDGSVYAGTGEVVFASINYRLGGFGYLMPGKDEKYSNLGLLDQIAALKWIRENIALFGGDNSNITVMGESAGAMSIGILLGTPSAAGLFDRAIIQSGGARPVWKNDHRKKIREELFKELKLSENEAHKIFELSAYELNNAFERLAMRSGTALMGGEAFHPGIDGIVLPDHPLKNIHGIPILIGHCKNEANLFEAIGVKQLTEGLPLLIESNVGSKKWTELVEVYKLTTSENLSWESALFSDCFVGIATHRIAQAVGEKGSKVWSYRYDYEKASELGATHAVDLALTFGATDGTPASPEWTPETDRLSKLMRKMFIQFAVSGDPKIKELPLWPDYNSHQYPFMAIDSKPKIKFDFIGKERRDVWQDVSVYDV